MIFNDKTLGMLRSTDPVKVKALGSTTAFSPENGTIYTKTLAAGDSFTFNGMVNTVPCSFELWLTQPSTAVTFSFANFVVWEEDGVFDQNNQPDMSHANSIYCIRFTWNGSVFLARHPDREDPQETVISCLTSTGTQFIKLPATARFTGETGKVLTFRFKTTSTSADDILLFGGKDATENRSGCYTLMQGKSSNTLFRSVGGRGFQILLNPYTPGSVDTLTLTGTADGVTCDMSGTAGITLPAGDQLCPLTLFGRAYYSDTTGLGTIDLTNSDTHFSALTILEYKLVDNGTTIIDLVPRLHYGIPCMKDTVTGTFYHNAGTGVFTYAE